MRGPTQPCPVCGYEPLERGGPNDLRGVDGGETECPRCLAQHALNDDGTIDFTFDLPYVPLPRERWQGIVP